MLSLRPAGRSAGRSLGGRHLDATSTRRRRRIRTSVAATVAASAAALALFSPVSPRVSASASGCSISAKGVPACGALWGLATKGYDATTVTSLESQVGRKFDIVYHFHGIDQTVPTLSEKSLVAGGRYLHVNLESKRFLSGGTVVPYGDVAAGKLDTALRAQANAFKALGKPVFVTFEHEPDARSKYLKRGTPAQFVAAWRHIHNVYVNQGASNVVWVWVVTGWPGNQPQEMALYPGNAYVDWLSWDPYNLADCQDGTIDSNRWLEFQQTFAQEYSWFRGGGSNGSIDGSKPFMFSEFASVYWPANPGAVANWYSKIPSVLKNYPQVKAVETFSVKNDCDFRVTNSGTVLSAFATAGHDAYLNP